MLVRLVCIIAGILVLAHGVEGLRVNTTPKTFTIEEIERKGVGDARYIIVNGGESNGVHAIYVAKSVFGREAVFNVLHPVFSRTQLAAGAAREETKTPVSLVYKVMAPLDCRPPNASCGKTGPMPVKGVVRAGLWERLIGENKRDAKTLAYPLANNFIFVEDKEPAPALSYVMFIFGGAVLVFLGLIRKALFRKYVLGK